MAFVGVCALASWCGLLRPQPQSHQRDRLRIGAVAQGDPPHHGVSRERPLSAIRGVAVALHLHAPLKSGAGSTARFSFAQRDLSADLGDERLCKRACVGERIGAMNVADAVEVYSKYAPRHKRENCDGDNDFNQRESIIAPDAAALAEEKPAAWQSSPHDVLNTASRRGARR